MIEPMHSVEMYSDSKKWFTLNWHDQGEMAIGVTEAAHHAIEQTVKRFGADCVNQSGALEHHVKVPEVGMVYVVVQSVAGQGKFVVHCSRSRQTMSEIFEDCQASL